MHKRQKDWRSPNESVVEKSKRISELEFGSTNIVIASGLRWLASCMYGVVICADVDIVLGEVLL